MKRVTLVLLTALSIVVFPLSACSGHTMSEEGRIESPPAAPFVPNLPPISGEETKDRPPMSETAPQTSEGKTKDEPPMSEVDPPKTAKKDYIRVVCDGLNVRTDAGTSYPSLGTLGRGELLPCFGERDGWFETRYDRRTAYMSADARHASLFSMEAGSDAIERVIDEGAKLLGVPYVYGAIRLHDGRGNFLSAFTDAAFDCSSLMQYIFYRGAGVLLDVTTRTQVMQGNPVGWTEIERGDLLFFTNAARKNNTGIERIGHVALYLGEGYILHTASDFGKIEQISATRRENFITARRIL